MGLTLCRVTEPCSHSPVYIDHFSVLKCYGWCCYFSWEGFGPWILSLSYSLAPCSTWHHGSNDKCLPQAHAFEHWDTSCWCSLGRLWKSLGGKAWLEGVGTSLWRLQLPRFTCNLCFLSNNLTKKQQLHIPKVREPFCHTCTQLHTSAAREPFCHAFPSRGPLKLWAKRNVSSSTLYLLDTVTPWQGK